MIPSIRSIAGSWHVVFGANSIDLRVSSSRRNGYTLRQLRREFASRIEEAKAAILREGGISPWL
jgi:hypothetical protein